MSIDITDTGAEALNLLAQRFGTKKRVLSRLVEWVAAQGPDLQSAILGNMSRNGELEIYKRWIGELEHQAISLAPSAPASKPAALVAAEHSAGSGVRIASNQRPEGRRAGGAA